MKFNTKFDIDQAVWFMRDNKPVSMPVHAISIFVHTTNGRYISYRFVPDGGAFFDLNEGVCFATKEELLASL